MISEASVAGCEPPIIVASSSNTIALAASQSGATCRWIGPSGNAIPGLVSDRIIDFEKQKRNPKKKTVSWGFSSSLFRLDGFLFGWYMVGLDGLGIWVLLGFIGFQWVLLGFTGFYYYRSIVLIEFFLLDGFFFVGTWSV